MSEIFSPGATQKHVDAFISTLSPGSKRIIVGYVKTDGSCAVAYIERWTPHWTTGLIGGYAPKEGWTGELVFKGEW